MDEATRLEKMNLLKQYRYQLSLDEGYLDCYCNSVKPEEVTFAMRLADHANRTAYESLKKLVEDLEKELGITSDSEI